MGWPGIKHVSGEGANKDYSELIQQALNMPGFSDKDVAKSKEPSLLVRLGRGGGETRCAQLRPPGTRSGGLLDLVVHPGWLWAQDSLVGGRQGH